MKLEHELRTFRRVLPAMLGDPASRGQYALVRGDDVAGVFPTFEAALDAGYDRFGLAPFLVKQVTDSEPPKVFPRGAS